MNRIDHAFHQLLTAAVRAGRPAVEPLPQHLEAGILARWRRTPLEDDFAPLIKLFRQAVIFAGVLLLLSAAWNYVGGQNGAATTALATYAANLQLPP
jgi:hypothetical protein